MIKAIIFDCFGVLVRGTLEQFIDNYLSHDISLVKRAHHLNDQASLGKISYEEQLEEFSKMASISIDKTHEEMDNNTANNVLIRFIRENLKSSYKIGFLSNASDNWLNKLFSPEDANLFDDVVLSCDVKIAKPDSRIYILAAARLGVEPEECIFIDDIDSYGVAAEDVGMKSVHFVSTDQAIKDIDKLLDVTDTDE